MKTNRRQALRALALWPLARVAAAADGDATHTSEQASPFMGSWSVTKGTTSILLSVEPQGEALYLYIEKGAFSTNRVKWQPMPAGILLLSLPRFRFWAGKGTSTIRVEREDFPREDVSEAFKQFPLSFFMRRATLRDLPPALAERALPAGWDRPTLPLEWDKQAGKWNI